MLRALAVAHIVIAIVLIPMTLFPLTLAPVLLIGPVWSIRLGLRMWRREPGVVRTLRRTHYTFLVVDGLLIWWGFAALRAAEESAKRGGGLLGGFGLIPIGVGVTLALFSIVTLLLTLRGDVMTSAAVPHSDVEDPSDRGGQDARP